MSYYIIQNQNQIVNQIIPRTNYQLAIQPRISFSRSPVIYQNIQIQQLKQQNQPIIRHLSPKVNPQYFTPYVSHQTIQSPSSTKIITPSIPTKNIINYNTQHKSLSPLPISQNSQFHNLPIIQNAKKQTFSGQSHSKINSLNHSQANMKNSQNNSIIRSAPFTIITFCQSSNHLNSENVINSFQQNSPQLTIEQKKQKQVLNSQQDENKIEIAQKGQQKDIKSTKSTLSCQNTAHSESDQILLDIVSKYVGGQSQYLKKNISPSKKINPLYEDFNLELAQSYPGFSNHKQQQQQQILTSHYDSSSKGNYTIEDTFRNQTNFNSIESIQCFQNNRCINSIEAQQNEKSSPRQLQNYSQLDEQNKEIFLKSEKAKLQHIEIQRNTFVIQKEVSPSNQIKISENISNNEIGQQSNQSVQDQHLQKLQLYQKQQYDQQQNEQQQLLIKQQQIQQQQFQSQQQQLQQKQQQQQLQQEQKQLDEKKIIQQQQQLQSELMWQQNNIFEKELQIAIQENIKNQTKTNNNFFDPLFEENLEIKISSANNIKDERKSKDLQQFKECSDNLNQKFDYSDIDDLNQAIFEDDKQNLQVFEDENQIFDFRSNENLEEEKLQLSEKEAEQLALELNNLKQRNSKINSLKPLDPIQEEDFLSKSSIDNIKAHSNTQISNQNTINQVLSDNKIPSKQEIQQVFEETPRNSNKKQSQRCSIVADENKSLKEEFEIFESNIEGIGFIEQRGSQNNLFSQDSYDNILDMYSSAQSLNQKEQQMADQKCSNTRERQKSQSETTNNSQQFQTVSSLENAESFRRSLVNVASFGHSPQISFGGQLYEQQYIQMPSATFNQETLQTEQNPENEDENIAYEKQKVYEINEVKEEHQDSQQQTNEEEEVVLINNYNKNSEKEKKTVVKNTLQDTIVMIIFMVIVLLIGCFFIFFIQENSLIGQIQQNLTENEQKYQNQTSFNYQTDNQIDNMICYAICEIEESIYDNLKCYI